MHNQKICKFCNKKFYKEYSTKDGRITCTSNTVQTIFCSKSCATKYQRSGVELSKDLIEREIIDYIILKNKYCTLKEITIGIKRSSKTINKFNISILELNRNLGFTHKKGIFSGSIYRVLKEQYNNIVCEYTNENLLSPKGFKLRIDFYIPSENLMIEADGLQHYDVNNTWYSEYLKECDEIKNQYCLDNNIKLVRIVYKTLITKKYVLDCVVKS